jgi:hypothetical protein
VADDDKKTSFIDRLGPTLTSALIITIGSGVVYGAVAVRDLVVVATNDLTHLAADVDRLRTELEGFKSPGGRFTAADGARHDERIRRVEDFAKLCGESKVKVELELEHLKDAQQQLCSRLQMCNTQGGKR